MPTNAQNEPEYTKKGFIVLVEIPVPDEPSLRDAYVVGCVTEEEAIAQIRKIYPPGQIAEYFGSPISEENAIGLKLRVGEVRPW